MKIYVKDILKAYDNNVKLKIKELTIPSGIICGIIGSNGAGKSTFMRIISGLDNDYRGSVYYGDDLLDKLPRMSVTMVFQKPYMLRTTVENNIAYPMKLRRWDKNKIKERVNELIEKFEMQNQAKQKAWNLSGGETQKVALARALSFKPELLLLDEPTSNIDPKTLNLMESMLIDSNKNEKTTIIIVTHNIQQARRICHQVLLFDNGKIIDTGATEEVIKKAEEYYIY